MARLEKRDNQGDFGYAHSMSKVTVSQVKEDARSILRAFMSNTRPR